MKYRNKLVKFLMGGLVISCLCLCSCKNSEISSASDSTTGTEESSPTGSTDTTQDSEVPDSSASESVEESTGTETQPEAQQNTKELSIHLVNTCGVEIGMVSYINPATKEQVDVGALPDGTLLTLDFVWPLDVAEFQWALYNTEGQLCMECTTDISEASTAATLILTGEGNVESVTTQFE